MFFLLGRNHPVIRILIGAAIIVLGLFLHRVWLESAGAVAVVVGAVYWLYTARRGGRTAAARRADPGDRW